jgi:hypothetical protein
MEQFTGLVVIQDGAGNPTVLLDGDSADVTLGKNGQDGKLTVGDGAGTPRISVDGATATVTVLAPDGSPLVTIDGQEGDITVFREVTGVRREVLRFDASDAALTLGSRTTAATVDGSAATRRVGTLGHGGYFDRTLPRLRT